jgi:serine/threonine protein kinase
MFLLSCESAISSTRFGPFGSVFVAFLKSGVPDPNDVVEKRDARAFAIKVQSYEEKESKAEEEILNEKSRVASVTEPKSMQLLNGGPYVGSDNECEYVLQADSVVVEQTIHYYGHWNAPSATEKGNRSFSIVMPVAKSDLEAEIRGKGPFWKDSGGRITLDKARILIAQIVIALGHAHQKGIIHRDLKPANILLDSKRRVMLGDLGCSMNFKEMALRAWIDAKTCDNTITAPEVQFHLMILQNDRRGRPCELRVGSCRPAATHHAFSKRRADGRLVVSRRHSIQHPDIHRQRQQGCQRPF